MLSNEGYALLQHSRRICLGCQRGNNILFLRSGRSTVLYGLLIWASLTAAPDSASRLALVRGGLQESILSRAWPC